MFSKAALCLLCLSLSAKFSAAQAGYPCGKTNNATNSTTTCTDPSSLHAALTDSSGSPCSSYTGNIVIIPTTNYNLPDYGGPNGFVTAFYGSVLINCTGVSTDVPFSSEDSYSTFSALASATGSFSMLGCSTISILDLYTLVTLGGDLAISGNPTLSLISLYALQNINGSLNIQMEIPDPYDSISVDLTALQTVGGDINITGPVTSFTEAKGRTVPNLTSVQGSVFINSTGQLDCAEWQQLNESGVIKGSFFCASTSTLHPNLRPSVHLSKAAIAGIVVGSVVAIGVVLTGCFLAAKRKGRKVSKLSETKTMPDPSSASKGDAKGSGVAELAGRANVPEMVEASELGRRELEGLQQNLAGGEEGRRALVSAEGQQGQSELEGATVTRGSYTPAELSGWYYYEAPTGAERHEMSGLPRNSSE